MAKSSDPRRAADIADPPRGSSTSTLRCDGLQGAAAPRRGRYNVFAYTYVMPSTVEFSRYAKEPCVCACKAKGENEKTARVRDSDGRPRGV